MKKQVTKAVIPAAGLGTRFLPATKVMPKEMLPIVDKPTIQYIVEEAVASGIEDIIIVTGKGKRAIEDHFDQAYELEQVLTEKEKFEMLEEVQKSNKMANIHYIRQQEAKGLGHAVWCARSFIGEEPFAVLLGDDIVEAQTPCLKQLIDQYEEKQASIIGVQTVASEDTKRYGIIDPLTTEGKLTKVQEFIEKPAEGMAPSNLAIMGRYILKPSIFAHLEKQEIGSGGEIQLTDAIQRVNEDDQVYAYDFDGIRYDVGEKLGFVLTTMAYALRDKSIGEEARAQVQKMIEQFDQTAFTK